ncbi:12154_t:CDS:10 [Entrophospora sp. SA101]|nr:12154_t:CDS:10 [Entrophospora sp. SA101]
MAILTLWYFQAYLSDLSSNPSSPAFTVCKRVINKCQSIVFEGTQSDDQKSITDPGISSKKVKENVLPALVGIGAMVAGIFAPSLMKSAGQIAIAQGRRARGFEINLENLPPSDDNDELQKHEIGSTYLSTDDDSNTDEQFNQKSVKFSKKNLLRSSSSSFPHRNGVNLKPLTSPSLDDLHKGSLMRRNNKFRPQSVDLTTNFKKKFFFNEVVDNDDEIFTVYRTSTEFSDDALLDEIEEYGPERQRRLLKGNYFNSELQFLLALQDISSRLIIVPKKARQSALEAELTILNHSLPAEICIPLWCPASSEKPYHHRVLRISPSDAVVLNSAERVPYLLMVEVLEGEMNIDMAKLQRQKSLHRLFHEEKSKRLSIELPPAATDPKQTQDDNTEIGTEIPSESIKNLQNGDDNENQTTSSKSSKRTASIDKLIMSAPNLNTIVESDSNDDPISIPSETSLTISYTPTSPTLPESNSEYLKEVINRRQSNSADEFAEKMQDEKRVLSAVNRDDPSAAVFREDWNTKRERIRKASPFATSSKSSKRTASIDKLIMSAPNLNTIVESDSNDDPISIPSETSLTISYTPTSPTLPESNSEYLKEVINRRQSNSADEFAEKMQDEKRVLSAVNRDDPSAAVFREDWNTKRERIRKASPFGNHPNWRLFSVIVKTGADLRQEQLACQLIKEMERIWQKDHVNVWVKYYRVLVTSDHSGLIETIQNSISIHSIKKDAYAKRLNEKGFVFTLFDYFVKTYGDVTSEAFLRAQDNFMRSLAAYSLVSYILQVKDRHNGNILVDTEGHLIYIDFGFMLSNSPGSVGFELAPFKLSQEYLDILGGLNSEKFLEFKSLLKQAFNVLRKHADNIVSLVEMTSKDSKLPCFLSGEATSSHLKDRFQLTLTQPQFDDFVEKLIMSSCCNAETAAAMDYDLKSKDVSILPPKQLRPDF